MNGGMVYSEILKTNPVWLKDFVDRDKLHVFPARLDAAQFTADQGGILVKANGAALADATTIAVDALSGPIPAGALLIFGAYTSKKFARLTVAAAAGATSLTVNPIPTALADNDEAVYSKYGKVFIPSGTVVGRTIAERDAGNNWGPAVSTDDEISLTLHDVEDVAVNDNVELIREKSGVQIAENYLPNWTTLAGALKTQLRARFNLMLGAD